MRTIKNLYINRVLSILMVMSLSLWAEPSVYGFDDEYIEDSPNIAIDTRNTPNKNVDVTYDNDIDIPPPPPLSTTTTIDSLKEQVDEQSERIDGLITIIDGLSKSLKEIRQSSKVSSSYDIPIEDIKEDEVVEADANVKVDNITSVEPIVYNTPPKPPKPEVKSNNLIFSEGVTSFLNKEYTKAKERFTLTDSKGYKVGTSNYYLGEIAYYTKDYESAIFHYKKSAGISDKTSYIDTLLLHTGISFENSGKKEKAKAFYQNIIANYPNNKTAKIAKEKLRNM